MAATALTERYAANLHGVLSCYDRIIITGTLPGACYAGGMTNFLYSRGIRIFDYARFAEPLRERVRERAQEVCEASAVSVEHVKNCHIRKEELMARVLRARGDAPGLVHVISAMEACPSYKPWHDKASGKTFLRPDQRKSARWRARSSVRASSSCRKTTPSCASPTWRAQSLADSFNPEKLHHRLTRYVHWLCPVADVFAQDDWHWSIRQAEYSTDLMFRSREILVPLYDAISRQGRAQRRCATCSGLPGQEDHSCSGARGRLAAVHAHRGPLHQSLHSSSRHELLKTGRPANLCY